MSLANSKAVIFDGGSGIGLAAAKGFATAGAEVVLVGRDAAKLERAKREIAGKVATQTVDATDEQAVSAFFKQLGAFDHLVMTVGGNLPPTPFKDIDPRAFRAAFDAKFWAQFTVAQAAAAQIRPGGSITFIGGAASRRGIRGAAPLAAINGALDAMVRPMAVELAPIRVNVIAPAATDTPFWSAMPPAAKEAFFNRMAQVLPVGRAGKPEDIAKAVLFLADNGFVTGTVLDVEGGLIQAAAL